MSNLPTGVTDADIERHFGGDDLPDSCDECGADASFMEWADDGDCCAVAVCRAQEPEILDASPCGARVTVRQCRGCARASYDDGRD